MNQVSNTQTCPHLHDWPSQILTFWEKRSRVLSSSRLSSGTSWSFVFGFMFTGSRQVTIGWLLERWNRGELLQPCPECGGNTLVYQAGSGLSFTIWLGVCTACRKAVRKKTDHLHELLVPAIRSDTSECHPPSISRQHGTICFTAPAGDRVINCQYLPISIVYRYLIGLDPVSDVTDMNDNLVLRYNWIDCRGINRLGDPIFEIRENHLYPFSGGCHYRSEFRKIVKCDPRNQSAIDIYEIEVRGEAVYVQMSGINYLPRRYIIQSDRILSYPSKEILLKCHTEIPFPVFVLMAAGEIA